jgi:hypothetical protein
MANRQSSRKSKVLEEIQGYCPEKGPARMNIKHHSLKGILYMNYNNWTSTNQHTIINCRQ